MCWHKWSKWKLYGVVVQQMDQSNLIPVQVSKVQLRQRRECTKCGSTQDKHVAYTNNTDDVKDYERK